MNLKTILFVLSIFKVLEPQITLGGCEHQFSDQQNTSDTSPPDFTKIFPEAVTLYNQLKSLKKQIGKVESRLKHLQGELAKSDEDWFFVRWFSQGKIAATIATATAQLRHLQLEKQFTEKKINQLKGRYQLRTELLSKIKVAANSQDQGNLVKDMLNVIRLQVLNPDKTVALAFGNPNESLPPSESKQLTDLALNLIERGYTIVYDADSSFADTMVQLQSNQVLGISYRSASERFNVETANSTDQHQLVFANPYFKLQAFLQAKVRIVNPTSVFGAGLIAYDQANIVFDPDENGHQNLKSWPEYLKAQNIDLGLRYSDPPLLHSTEAVSSFKNQKGKELFEPVKAKPVPQLTDLKLLDMERLVDLWNYVEIVSNYHQQFSNQNAAVIFGSSGLHTKYSAKMYDMAQALAKSNIAVVTGGAGGLMMASNLGAHDAGGTSVGIAIIGGDTPTREQRVYQEYQTQTIKVNDYPKRIGLLLAQKQLILVAPGRSGTMRELATAFAILAADPDNSPPIVFTDRQYYDLLYRWLRSLPFADSYKLKLHVVDSYIELYNLLEQFGLSQTQDPPLPRSDRQSFPKYLFKMELP